MNSNLKALHAAFTNGKRGVLLEGSSRSGKTWSAIDFLIWLGSTYDGIVINVIRDTFASFRNSLYDDFNKRLPMFGLPAPFLGLQNVRPFQLFGARINFIGADSMERYQGMSCDFAWFEEMLDVDREIFDQAEMRCRKFWLGTFNPKTTTSFVFESVEPRKDVVLFHSTYKDNPHLSIAEKRKIESFEPNATNDAAGTSDQYMWDVYGLGKRSSPEGLIFRSFEWVAEFGEVDRCFFGADVGITNPSAIAKVGVNGKNIYLECLAYKPTESTDEFVDLLASTVGRNDVIWVDSAAPLYIAKARRAGFATRAVKKFPGSRMAGFSILKNYKIHLVKNDFYYEVKKEFTSLRYKQIYGIAVHDTVGASHFIDSCAYASLSNLR